MGVDISDPMMGIGVRDRHRDSLAVLPLGILPFRSVTLRGLLMVKNNYYESVIQMFDGDGTGSGHIKAEDLKRTIGEISEDDFSIVRNVASLYSFDVYSLRIQLRDMGIEVNDTKYLSLSAAKQTELERYVRPFTNRLVAAIYGDDEVETSTIDVTQLFRDADDGKAREKLKAIAARIKIDLTAVPAFLEDYGDIYLSIAYYRSRLEQLDPIADEFANAMEALINDQQFKNHGDVLSTARKMVVRIDKMRDVLRQRFHLFKQSTDDMWDDMSAENFGQFKVMVENNHAAIGGILCKLGVKLDAWNEKFPNRRPIGPARYADFLMSDMRQGF